VNRKAIRLVTSSADSVGLGIETPRRWLDIAAPMSKKLFRSI
jgi:hypothetical protein